MAEAAPGDVALTIISEGVPLTFTHVVCSGPRSLPTCLTPHSSQNLTASIVSWASLFPASPKSTRPTLSDSLMSFHHPSTPYGFGLALFAVFASAALLLPTLPEEPTHDDLLKIFSSKSSPPPSLLFGAEKLIASPLYKLLLTQMLGDSAFIIRLARNGKIRLLREGTVSSKTFWDKILFVGVRKESYTHKLRAVFIEGPMEQSRSEMFRSTLGVPVVSTLGHAFLLAPVSAGMMWDMQSLPHPDPEADGLGHVGPPVAGVEIKLRGDEDEMQKGRVKGEVSFPLGAPAAAELTPFASCTAARSLWSSPATIISSLFPSSQRFSSPSATTLS